MRVRISVAVCTFNGQAYLPAQLKSLLAQPRRPDEIVVRDDRSTDGTMEIIREFANSSPIPVSFSVNESTLGPARNFERAIGDCSGDVIALCDQDDIWFAGKLAAIESAFLKNPSLGLFFGDAEMVDASGNDLAYRLWSSVGLTGSQRRRTLNGSAFEVLLRQNVATGATMAFASWYRPLVLPIDPLWMHDGWIALLIAACGQVHAEPRPLIRYRQHPAQTVGAARRSLFQQYLNAKKMDRAVFEQQAEMYEAVMSRLTTFFKCGPDSGPVSVDGLAQQLEAPAPEHLQKLSEKIQHCRTRSEIRLRKRARLLSSVRELLRLRYRRFSLGWKSFAQDLFL